MATPDGNSRKNKKISLIGKPCLLDVDPGYSKLSFSYNYFHLPLCFLIVTVMKNLANI